MKVLVSEFDPVLDFLEEKSVDLQWLVTKGNQLLSKDILNASHEVDNFLFTYRETIPYKDMSTASLYSVVEILRSIKYDEPDLHFFVKWNSQRFDHELDVTAFSKVYLRIQSLNHWHDVLSSYKNDGKVRPVVDIAHLRNNIEMNLNKLAFHPGGKQAAWEWHQRHLHLNFPLPSSIRDFKASTRYMNLEMLKESIRNIRRRNGFHLKENKWKRRKY